MLGSNISTASTSLVNATGLSFTADANTHYIIEADIIWESNTALGGIGFSLNGPATPTAVVFHWSTFSALSSLTHRFARAWNGGSTALTLVDSANASIPAKMYATVITGASGGTITVRYCAGGVLATVTIIEGSSIRYRVVE